MSAIAKERKIGSVTMLELGPRLTFAEVFELNEAVKALLESGCEAVLLDCSRLTFIDSMGVGAMVRNWVSVGRKGRLKLFGLQPNPHEVLQITGVLKLMECFDDVGSALRSFQ